MRESVHQVGSPPGSKPGKNGAAQSQSPKSKSLSPLLPTRPPSFRSYAPEVIQYARYLGMDPVADQALLWIAQQGLDAPLPAGWAEYAHHDGAAYFHNRSNAETSWTHPTDAHYWNLYRKLKKQQRQMKVRAFISAPVPPATVRSSAARPATHHSNTRPATEGVSQLPELNFTRPQTSPDGQQSAPVGSNDRGGCVNDVPQTSRFATGPTDVGYISNILSLVRGDTNRQSPEQLAKLNALKEKEQMYLLQTAVLQRPRRCAAAMLPNGKREFSKEQRRAIFSAVNPPNAVNGHTASLIKPDLIARPPQALLWVPPKVKKIVPQEYRVRRQKNVKPKTRSVEEEKSEIMAVAKEIDVSLVQLTTLYKAFKRHAFSDEQFSAEEWGALLTLIGVQRSDVKERIFAVWSKGRSKNVEKRFLKFRDATVALCALGVGGRSKQAQAVFKLCDFNDDGSVSRSELLGFAQEQHPLGKHLPRKDKSALFVHVGKLFEKLGVMSSKEEITMPRFIDSAVEDDVVWEHLHAINPYRHYFSDWDDSASGIQNVLNALLLMADSKEQRATVKDRVMALAAFIDDSGDGLIDEDEILTALLTIGYQPDEADDIAADSCGEDGMRVEDFVKIFTTIAEGDIKKFAKVEEAYGMNKTD